ncbi:MAG: tripartite tricarboxylate transporter substrate binding protein [Lautropia sp.]|nr:tripartite tricarboxylate transporter substrate binding protein [Lautropia sp.]
MSLTRRQIGNLTILGATVAAAFALSGWTGTLGGYQGNQPFNPGNRNTLIVPFKAGGGSDQSGRAIAAGLEEATAKNISVENHEGGSGAVGYSNFLRMHGDGSKLLATETALIALPLTQDVRFNWRSFTPIMKLGDDYTLIVVRKDSPFTDLRQAIVSTRGKRVTIAVSGATSLDEVVFSLIEQDQNVRFDRVPYESGGEVLTGLLGGHVEMASLNPGEVIGHLQSGELRALAAIAPERYEYDELKDIPTGIEQGINVAFAQFRGVIAPGGIPEDARSFWIEAARRYATTPAADAYLAENFMQKAPVYGDDFSTYLDDYNKNLAKVLGAKK